MLRTFLGKATVGTAAALAAHLSLSAASISSSLRTSEELPAPSGAAEKVSGNRLCETCSREAVLTKVVQQMYARGKVDAPMFTEDVTFEDPAAICVGHNEVAEAFRALKVLQPKLLDPPTVTPSGSVYVADLHNEYLLRNKAVVLRSSLFITVGPDGRIVHLEERWNHRPLLDVAPVRWARRVNGVLSYSLTRFFVNA